MLNDGEQGIFEEYLNNYGEVTVNWTWYDGDDWEMDGHFDVFISCGDLDITYDIPKESFNYIYRCVKERAGYESPSIKRVGFVINGLANNIF
jgi:hypothetical protein